MYEEVIINPQVLTYGSEYYKVKNSYTSNDPRLYSPLRSYRQTFDTVPIETNLTEEEISSMDQTNYEGSLDRLNRGNVLYSANNVTNTPFNPNVFGISNIGLNYVTYKHPNGPVVRRYNGDNIIKYKISRDSATNDAVAFRTDLMIKQQRKNNETKYMYNNHVKKN